MVSINSRFFERQSSLGNDANHGAPRITGDDSLPDFSPRDEGLKIIRQNEFLVSNQFNKLIIKFDVTKRKF